MEFDKKEQYFEDRTNKHIVLVQSAIEKIASKEWEEFDVNKLRELGKVHDASKFVEPERTPYIELTWNKFKDIEDTDPLTNQATLHHILNNSHHPEYWLEDKSEANINAQDRDKSDKVVDASKMPPLAIAEMVADWQAMAEELGTNTAREWFNKQKDVRWHFSKEQEDLIDRLLKVFEEPVTA